MKRLIDKLKEQSSISIYRLSALLIATAAIVLVFVFSIAWDRRVGAFRGSSLFWNWRYELAFYGALITSVLCAIVASIGRLQGKEKPACRITLWIFASIIAVLFVIFLLSPWVGSSAT